MKLEEQKLIRIDDKNILQVWTDLDTGQARYEVNGQTSVNVQTPNGVVQAPVNFRFIIEAENVALAADQLGDRLQEETDNAVRQFIDNLKAQQRKIQIAGGDQVIPFKKNGRQ